MVVLEEGSGVPTAHTPSDWLESEEFEPMISDPIFMSADKFTKAAPTGVLSRVGSSFLYTCGGLVRLVLTPCCRDLHFHNNRAS